MKSAWILALFTATRLIAQPQVLRLDPAATQVEFILPSTLHTVHGTFKLMRGEIRFDPASGAASGTIVIDATSGDSGGGARDSRMHKSILESSKYPEITFTPDRVEGQIDLQGESNLRVHGAFGIHGGSHELVLDVHARMEQARFTADTKFAVPYVKWGMKNPSTLFLRVNDTVEIEIHAAGTLTGAVARTVIPSAPPGL